MEDEEYARELFAILTRPLHPDDPVDAYGTGPDGIDRYDGFGTEVHVTSIDVVAGQHGAQIEVGFSLAVPEAEDVPAAGSVLLPFAAEWREAQGHTSPAVHAPWVARDVMRGAGSHHTAHRRRADPPRPLPDTEEQHTLLLEVFGFWGEVEEVAPGRLSVRRPPGRRSLTVLVTPEQWSQVLQLHDIRRAWLFEHFSELLASGTDAHFLVFWEGDLVRSVREELPPVDGSLRALLAMQAAGPPKLGPNDGWYAYRPLPTEDDELPG